MAYEKKPYEQKPGDFILFRNEFKKDNPKAPDYKGRGLSLDGKDVELAAWIRNGPNGKFMSGNFKIKQQQ